MHMKHSAVFYVSDMSSGTCYCIFVNFDCIVLLASLCPDGICFAVPLDAPLVRVATSCTMSLAASLLLPR